MVPGVPSESGCAARSPRALRMRSLRERGVRWGVPARDVGVGPIGDVPLAGRAGDNPIPTMGFSRTRVGLTLSDN